MLLQNKTRIAYLGALTLLFSYAEMILPRFVPFFRLGLGNIAILLALNLNFPSFLLLTIIKSITASMMAGTLLSPFFLISITQSVISGLTMFGLNKIRKNWISIYGISMAGSAISAIVQLLMTSIYLGKETLALTTPMLFFSIIAAIITAFLSQILKIPEDAPALKNTSSSDNSKKSLVQIFIILLAVIICFMLNNIYILSAICLIAFIIQKITGRKILIIPHISIWIFVIIVSLLSPSGKVLYKIKDFTITQGALFLGISKSLKLSIAAALSQCAASLRPSATSLIGLTLAYYRGLLDNFQTQEGKFLKRLQGTLSSENL